MQNAIYATTDRRRQQVGMSVYLAIDLYRQHIGMSMTEFARDEIHIRYDTYWNTLKRGTTPRDYNQVKYRRYYYTHEAQIAPFLDAEAAKAESALLENEVK